MKITKKQLVRLIRESMKDDYRRMGNFDPDSREMHAAPKQDLRDFAATVAAYAFEEDTDYLDMSDPSDLEWIANSDKEIARVGEKYGRTPEEIGAFLALNVEERKGLLR